MSTRLKALFLILMALALSFGFFHLMYPDLEYSFARLHIFLFNLCTGCTIMLYFTERYRRPSIKVRFFLLLTIAYAVFAFFNTYLPVILITPFLIVIVEIVRIRRFSFLPTDFFRSDVKVWAKFHHAALLCLSIGLLIAGLVTINNAFYPVIAISKLNLNIFFLGYSFPLTLITMSLIFSIMEENSRHVVFLKNLSFWAINLGVITFFVFILAEVYIPQVAITLVLFSAVLVIFHMFANYGRQLQQKMFLISGMTFLMVTAVTGIWYIMLEFSSGYDSDSLKWLLQLHAFTALYGWNLCGLAIICRYNDFPIRLHSTGMIVLHWLIVAILAPLGSYHPTVAALAVIGYVALVYTMFFSRPTHRVMTEQAASADKAATTIPIETEPVEEKKRATVG